MLQLLGCAAEGRGFESGLEKSDCKNLFFYRALDDFIIIIIMERMGERQENGIAFERSFRLHGPAMFAVKVKIYGVLYKQSSSIVFDETSSYWSALKSS